MSPAARAGAAAPSSAALRSFEAQWLARRPDPLATLREKAMTQLLQHGLPSMRDETWRYTNLRQLVAKSYIDAPRTAEVTYSSSPRYPY